MGGKFPLNPIALFHILTIYKEVEAWQVFDAPLEQAELQSQSKHCRKHFSCFPSSLLTSLVICILNGKKLQFKYLTNDPN